MILGRGYHHQIGCRLLVPTNPGVLRAVCRPLQRSRSFGVRVDGVAVGVLVMVLVVLVLVLVRSVGVFELLGGDAGS